MRYAAVQQLFSEIMDTPGLTRRTLGVAGAAAFLPLRRASAATIYDVVIYGATPAGVMAADAAARMGARVAMVEPTGQVGGALAQAAVSPIDLWTHRNIGGRTWQWMQQVANAEGHGNPGSPTTIPANDVTGSPAQVTTAYLHLQPHSMGNVFTKFLALSGVDVVLRAPLAVTGGSTNGAVKVSGTTITGLSTAAGLVSGRVFIDASYEGDVLAGAAAAGIAAYATGREASSTHGESLAGIGATKTFSAASLALLDAHGVPLAPLATRPTGRVGSADGLVMPPDYRLALALGGTAFAAPAGYDRARYAVVQQVLAATQPTTLGAITRVFTVNNSKFDMDGGVNALSFTLPNAFTPYVEASPTARALIVATHMNWTTGLLHYLATDKAVPAALAADVRRYGLANDEFTTHGNLPPQLYIRETRRLQGQVVMTQADLSPNATKASPVCLGSYVVDAKPARTFAVDAHTIGWEGGLYSTSTASWQIPMESLLPKTGHCRNLVVPVCCSTTHVAWAASRTEVTFMMQGEAAGMIAALAAKKATAVQAVPYATLRPSLLAARAVLA